jgi:hypothetical protein
MWDMSIMLYLIPISVIPLSGAHCNYQVKAGLVSDNLTSYLVKAGLVSNNLNSYLVKAAANLLSDVRLIPSIIPSVRGSMSRQTSLEATSQEMNLEKYFLIIVKLTSFVLLDLLNLILSQIQNLNNVTCHLCTVILLYHHLGLDNSMWEEPADQSTIV